MQIGADVFIAVSEKVHRRRGLLVGVLAGIAAGFMFLPLLVPFEVIERLARHAGLGIGRWGALALLTTIGGGIGLAAGHAVDQIRGARFRARRILMEVEARRLGAQFSPFADADLHARVRRHFGDVRLHNLLRKDFGGLHLVLADASITRDAPWDSESSQTTTQTVAYYEAPRLALPRVRVHPAGLLDKGALKTDPRGAEKLVPAPLREWLTAHRGVSVELGGPSVLVYRRKRMLGPGEFELLAAEAGELVRLL